MLIIKHEWKTRAKWGKCEWEKLEQQIFYTWLQRNLTSLKLQLVNVKIRFLSPSRIEALDPVSRPFGIKNTNPGYILKEF